jgi:ammonia channel protein AmtB
MSLVLLQLNLFVLFGDGAIVRKKMTETLHHVLRTMMQFPVFFFGGYSITEQTNKSFHNSSDTTPKYL